MSRYFVTGSYTNGTRYTYKKVVVSPKKNHYKHYYSEKVKIFDKNKLYKGQIVYEKEMNNETQVNNKFLEIENELGQIIHEANIKKFNYHKVLSKFNLI